MKTGTKLHFTNIEDNDDKIEEFFVGGALPYEEYINLDNQTSTGIIYRIYNKESELLKSCVLDKEDFELFISKTNISINGINYRKILPVYDIYTLKQNLESRCTIIKGELPYDVQHGIPLKAQLQDIQLSILNIINNTPNVKSCEVLSSKLVNKKFRLEVKVRSNFGTFITTVG